MDTKEHLDFIEQEVVKFNSNVKELISTYASMNDLVKQQSREIFDSKIAINTLRKNLENTPEIENSILVLEHNLNNKNLENEKSIESFMSVKLNLETTYAQIRHFMKLLLDINDSIFIKLENTQDKVLLSLEDEQGIIQSRKLCYSNIIDNHDLRVEPPIFGIKKTGNGLSYESDTREYNDVNGLANTSLNSSPISQTQTQSIPYSNIIPQSVLDKINKEIDNRIANQK